MQLGIGSCTYPRAVGSPGHEPPEPLSAPSLLDRTSEPGVSVARLDWREVSEPENVKAVIHAMLHPEETK